jgi:hypothetical protein
LTVTLDRIDVRIRPYAVEDARALHSAVSASVPMLSQWLPWATDDYDLARAEAWIALLIQPQNNASLRVAAKLGAVCEGIVRSAIVVAGRPHDAMVFSLIPSDLDSAIP